MHLSHDSGWRMPAEWARHAATWMIWPHNQALWETGWGVTLADVQRDYARVAAAIARFEPVKMVVDPSAMASASALCGAGIELIALAVNDSWCRDSGPSFLVHPQQGVAGVSWRFNAWGGKSEHGLDRSLARRILDQLGLLGFSTPLCNEGGAIHVDGQGTLITTESVLLNPNRNPGLGKADFEDVFARLLGIEKTIWLPGDPQYVTGDMTDGHVDGVCAFARPACCWWTPPTTKTRCTPKSPARTAEPWSWPPTLRGARSSCSICTKPAPLSTRMPRCSAPPTPTSTWPMAPSSCPPTVSMPTRPRLVSWPWPSPTARSSQCASTISPMAAAASTASPSNSPPGHCRRCAHEPLAHRHHADDL